MVVENSNVDYKSQINPNHKFTIVDTTIRDGQQSFSYPIKDFYKFLKIIKFAAICGFDIESGGGDLPMNMLRSGQNPIGFQAEIKKLLTKYSIKTEFLERNLCVVGYQPQSQSDLEFTLDTYSENFDRARIFAASNSLGSIIPPIEILQKNGTDVQVEFSPCYLNGVAQFKDEDVVNLFQTCANLGVKRFGLKIFDGTMPPDDVYRIVKLLKQEGVLPSGCEISVHTHDTHDLGAKQYEAALAAGCDSIHCANSSFAGSFSQPDVDYFVQNYSNQIKGFNLEAYENYKSEGKALARAASFNKVDIKTYLKDHSKKFVKALSLKHKDVYQEKFGNLLINEAVEKHQAKLLELFYDSGVPGGGIFNYIDRLGKAGFLRQGVSTGKFSNQDLLESYLQKLVELKPMLGSSGYVTPHYKNADDLAMKMVLSPDSKDPFDKGDGSHIAARRIFEGDFDPAQGRFDEKWSKMIKLQNLEKAFYMEKRTEKFFKEEPENIDALLALSEKINAAYEITVEKERLSKQKLKLQELTLESNDNYYKEQLAGINEKITNLESEKGISKESYLALMNRNNPATLTAELKEIISQDNRLKGFVANDDARAQNALAKCLRAVTELKCPASDVVPSRKAEVEALVVDLQNGKEALYSREHATAFLILAGTKDPAAPKPEQCVGPTRVLDRARA